VINVVSCRSNINFLRLHPYCGLISLSPGVVLNKICRLSAISISSEDIATCFVSLSNEGGNFQPVPKKDFNFIIYPPIKTVGKPSIIAPPCAVVSPILAAGIPQIITVAEPFIILSGGPTHTSISPTFAAGKDPISTVGAPGPIIGPPTCGIGGNPGVSIGQVCISVILAAGAPIYF
jgi:hypothetical protein